jgi:hypothetical protein
MRSTKLTLLAGSALALALTATSAGAHVIECSPGYWKNHKEVWIPAACGELNCDTLLGLLYWTGEKPGIFKNFAAGILNEWAGQNDITVNCDD